MRLLPKLITSAWRSPKRGPILLRNCNTSLITFKTDRHKMVLLLNDRMAMRVMRHHQHHILYYMAAILYSPASGKPTTSLLLRKKELSPTKLQQRWKDPIDYPRNRYPRLRVLFTVTSPPLAERSLSLSKRELTENSCELAWLVPWRCPEARFMERSVRRLGLEFGTMSGPRVLDPKAHVEGYRNGLSRKPSRTCTKQVPTHWAVTWNTPKEPQITTSQRQLLPAKAKEHHSIHAW